MIFGENYDKSLWLILKSDKDNRDEIVRFIKDIPEELYVRIRDNLEKYQEYLNSDNSNIGEFRQCGELVDKGNLYSFYIDSKNGALYLGKHVLNENGHYYNAIEISLIPSIDKNLKLFNKGSIGTVMVSLDKNRFANTYSMSDYSHIDYKFIDILGGNLMLVHDECCNGVKRKVRKINSNKMMSDYSLSDLDKIKF